ncbi:MAG: hypothetical protein ACR2O1_15735 [Boseongicola sp.]
MLEVSYAANSGVKNDKSTDLLHGPALLDILSNMSEGELAELEDELDFAGFTGIFGPILSGITGESGNEIRHSIKQAPSHAA